MPLISIPVCVCVVCIVIFTTIMKKVEFELISVPLGSEQITKRRLDKNVLTFFYVKCMDLVMDCYRLVK